VTTSMTRLSFNAAIIADSVNPDGNRLTTMVLKYPRMIHAELMTHRALSKNAASSRAIPIEKMRDAVASDWARPIRWGRNGKGMQDHGEFTGDDARRCDRLWQYAKEAAVNSSHALNAGGLHKQIVNRVLEPFSWMTTIVSATDWKNFFALRVHRDAQPEFQWLAYLALKAYVSGDPAKLEWGDWHIPYGDRMGLAANTMEKVKISTARCARVSYLTHDGKIDFAKDVQMHDDLSASGHWSPFEHPAQAERGRWGNFNGWKQYRKFFAGENRDVNLLDLLEEYEVSMGIRRRTGPEHQPLDQMREQG
jgi:hypothetical protein